MKNIYILLFFLVCSAEYAVSAEYRQEVLLAAKGDVASFTARYKIKACNNKNFLETQIASLKSKGQGVPDSLEKDHEKWLQLCEKWTGISGKMEARDISIFMPQLQEIQDMPGVKEILDDYARQAEVAS
ncbi:MAG: hypothetical protein ACPGXY_04950 [Alphaproteobacteria bacterium]